MKNRKQSSEKTSMTKISSLVKPAESGQVPCDMVTLEKKVQQNVTIEWLGRYVVTTGGHELQNLPILSDIPTPNQAEIEREVREKCPFLAEFLGL